MSSAFGDGARMLAVGGFIAGELLGGSADAPVIHAAPQTGKSHHEQVLQKDSPLGKRYAQLLAGGVEFSPSICLITQVADIPVIQTDGNGNSTFQEDRVTTTCGSVTGVKQTTDPVDWSPLASEQPSSTQEFIENGEQYTVVLDKIGTPIVAIETPLTPVAATPDINGVDCYAQVLDEVPAIDINTKDESASSEEDMVTWGCDGLVNVTHARRPVDWSSSASEQAAYTEAITIGNEKSVVVFNNHDQPFVVITQSQPSDASVASPATNRGGLSMNAMTLPDKCLAILGLPNGGEKHVCLPGQPVTFPGEVKEKLPVPADNNQPDISLIALGLLTFLQLGTAAAAGAFNSENLIVRDGRFVPQYRNRFERRSAEKRPSL